MVLELITFLNFFKKKREYVRGKNIAAILVDILVEKLRD